MYKITQLQVGAVPTGSAAEDSERDVILHVFAKDVLKNGSSRFQCMYEGLRQPSSGTVTVPMQGMVTNHVVLRGTYQTVPVTIYGFKLDSIASMKEMKDDDEHSNFFTYQDEVEYTKTRTFVCGTFLQKEHMDAVQVWGDDSSSAEEIVAKLQARMADTFFENIWMHSVDLRETCDVSMFKSAVNRAVDWISAFLSVFSEGLPCQKYEVDMGGYGLDILAICLQHEMIARDFVAHGGGFILRAILSVRGLPGSFYNKSVALAATLLKQVGIDACKLFFKETFSRCRLLHGDAFFPSGDSPGDVQNGKRSRQEKAPRRKSSKKKSKLDAPASGTPSEFSSAAKFLDNIENREYARIEFDFWRMQAESRDTLADVLVGHSTRFKPNFTSSQHDFVMNTLSLYRSCKTMKMVLKDLRDALHSGKGRLLDIMADLTDAIGVLISQMTNSISLRLLCEGNEWKIEEDASICSRDQISALLLKDYQIIEDLHRVIELTSSNLEASGDRGDFCKLLSVGLVDLFSGLMMNPEFLTPSSLHRFKRVLESESLLSSDNPHKDSLTSLCFEVDLHLDKSRRWAQLATTDWSTLGNTLVDLSIPTGSSVFVYHAETILQKCKTSIDRYTEAAVENIPDKQTRKSFEVAQTLLLELLSASHPQALKILLQHLPGLYDSIESLIQSNVLLDSTKALAQAQKILGGLFACTQVADGGILDIVELLDSQLPPLNIKDNTQKGMDQTEYFETLDAVGFGNMLSVTMSWDEIRLLLDDPERLGQTLTSMQFLRFSLQDDANESSFVVEQITKSGLALRVLVCATEIFSASLADNMWLHRVGTAMDICDIASNRSLAATLMESVTTSVCLFVEHLSKSANSVKIDNLPLLCALLKAHASICLESRAMMDIALQDFNNSYSLVMRKIRCNLANSLKCWIDSPRMTPRVIPTALNGAISAPLENGCTVSFSPASLPSLSMLLGDVFPSEWPKPGHKNHLLPEDRKYRAALTEEIESCIASFEHFVSCCITSETTYVQASALRFLSKGAGLGGGMGSFLMGILSSRFNEITSTHTLGAYALYDLRKILEILVPLMYQPSIKAAALDTSVPLNLAKLVERIIQQSSNPDSSHDRDELSSIMTMILECITVLADPSITLDVFKTSTSSATDVLGKDAGSLMSCIILDHIAVLGENIPLALNLLRLMGHNQRGRHNIQLGVIQLCMKSQGEKIENPTEEQIFAAAQWLVYQYNTILSQSSDETVEYIFKSLENILVEACVSNYDAGPAQIEKGKTAPARFVAVAKEASTRGTKMSIQGSRLKLHHLHFLQDCESLIVFWKNQSLRQMHMASEGAHSAKLAKYTGWNIGEEMDRFCMADILHPWMTHPVRPLNENMNAQPEDGDYQTEEEDIQVEQQEEPEKDVPIQTSPKLKLEETTTVEAAQKVDLVSLSEVLRTHAEGEEQPAGDDDEEIDLYADLYPSIDLPKTEEIIPDTHDVKIEEYPVQDGDIEENERVQINFNDEDDNDTNSTSEPDDEEVEANEDEPQVDVLPVNTNDNQAQDDSAPAFSQEYLEDLLKDQRKVEELLKSNPELLAQLKERLEQK